MNIVEMKLSEIKPYENNPRNNDNAVDFVANSIKEFGFKVPIVVDKNNVIVAGHTRLKAAKKLGITSVPCVIADDLTEQQIKAFRLADNKVSEASEWDYDLLNLELDDILDIDMRGFDFDLNDIFKEEKENRSLYEYKENRNFFEDNLESTDEYEDFVDKFKVKKTTDDCYTPPNVYESIKEWVINKYRLKGVDIVRPFKPNGDYKNENYEKNTVVIDNPPFSILSEIVRWYMDNKIKFFLFAPSLTLFCVASGECNYVVSNSEIVYENGAKVNTSFVTNLSKEKINISSELSKIIKEAQNNENGKKLPNYIYPKNLISFQLTSSLIKANVDIKINNAYFIRALQSQKDEGKAIYGGGFLIGNKMADKLKLEKEKAEKEKAEKEKAEKEKAIYEFQLGEKEIEIIKKLEELDD